MFRIVKDTEKSIRLRCEKVELPLKDEDKKLLTKMLDYLIKSQDEEYANAHNIRAGVGLAAPQIGVQKQMLVIYYDNGESITQYALVNPKIISSSVKMCYLQSGEGCLSVDNDHKGHVYRPYKIRVKAYDFLTNKEIEIIARGYDAIVLQHEIDHLSGVLYYDHIDKKNPFKILDNSIAL
jgi:peptide deformylase